VSQRSDGGSTGVARGPSATPGARDVLLLILGVAVLFVTGGIPLQLLLGEVGILLSQLLLIALPALFFAWRGGFDLRETFSLRPVTPRQVGGGLLFLFGGVQLAWFIAWVQGFFIPVPTELLEAMAEVLTADSLGRYLWLLLLAAVTPAFAEEVLFRGVVLSGLRRSLPPMLAVVLVGVIFGLFHLSPQTAFRFLPTAWLGVLLAWVVVASGSLPLAIFLHFVNNGMILTLSLLPMAEEAVGGPGEAPPLLLLPFAFLLLLTGARLVDTREAEVAAGGEVGGGDWASEG